MIEIVEPGLLTSVQDPVGRDGWRHLGVPVGGTADAWSARLANRLVGNRDDAALLEMTMLGATLRFEARAVIAVTGGLEASMDGIPLPQRSGSALRPGAVLRVAAGQGARGYVAVGGGIAVPRILGSCSTDLRGGFGGLDGRPLRAGDRLAMGRSASGPLRWVGHPREEGPIRIVPGPHAEGILHAFDGASFRAGTEADRTGVRMEELLAGGGETASMGLPLGAIQLPPDGRPIVMLADRPVTGGYRIPAVVIRADVSRVAQLRPGDPLRLALVSIDEARHAWRRAEEELAALDPLDEREDGELGWTGSHR